MNIKQGMDPAKQQIIDNILGSLPTSVETEVILPSEARLYTLIDPAIPITLRPMTFEDLLREIQTSKSTERKPAPEPVKPFQSYEEITEETVNENLPETEYSRDTFTSSETYKSYEKAKTEAFQRASLEETMSLASTDLKYSKFSEYQAIKEPSIADKLSADFRDPDTLKKYFIINEVLNRKWT